MYLWILEYVICIIWILNGIIEKNDLTFQKIFFFSESC